MWGRFDNDVENLRNMVDWESNAITRLEDGMLQCPFCGNAGILRSRTDKDTGERFWYPRCIECDCRLHAEYRTPEAAVADWNERFDLDEP